MESLNDREAGRSHWGKAWSALLAGGGIRGGRVIGSTTSNGGEPNERALGPRDLLATIYKSVGIDPDATVNDRQDRPVKIAPDGEPVRELF